MKNCTLTGLLAALATLITACSSTAGLLQHPTTSSTLWAQHAAEYRALTIQVYQTAAAQLGLAIEDSQWSAYPTQQDSILRDYPTAIVVDVDETVLNNSAFQARMIKKNSDFDPEAWNRWVMEARAEAVPGAQPFLKLASEKGIAIFYLTNRDAGVEAGTRANLRKLGFPLSSKEDRILSNGEQPQWTSEKSARRRYVGSRYRILMLFGDDLNDFIPAKNRSLQERIRLVNQHQIRWGRSWYILPNPTYGSWEAALYDFNNELTPREIKQIKRKRLNTSEGQ
ncbi:5'-nucleotidase, lipoprotein e(P4) family [Fodinibius sediminis]|uniref:Acid phosphatase n=1 Tax=Fodinibius sediminis TaxID=1214077 RepID=A0A521F2U7_9BACT|nr:HAD family acid phosphatase [Fodinibius sediminis]SMO90437.1 acid phosphatase [Fodinibius sediminis]